LPQKNPFKKKKTVVEKYVFFVLPPKKFGQKLDPPFPSSQVQEEKGRCLVHCRKGASRSVRKPQVVQPETWTNTHDFVDFVGGCRFFSKKKNGSKMGECFEFDEGLGVLVFFGRFRPQESGRTKKKLI